MKYGRHSGLEARHSGERRNPVFNKAMDPGLRRGDVAFGDLPDE
jgi:hypothetical protein